MTRRWGKAVAALMALVGALAVVGAAQAQGRTTIIPSNVGRQYLTAGFQSSLWLGSGTVRDLDELGQPAEKIGDFSTRAWGAGPAVVGIAHVVAPSLLFELRLGVGALVFEDDRLISTRLSKEGKAHVGLLLEAEVLGRYFHDSGLTASLGGNLGRVGLPEGSGAVMRLSPRVGWISWTPSLDGFFLAELGYQFPVINGLIPDFDIDAREAPIDSTWHVVTVAVSWGF